MIKRNVYEGEIQYRLICAKEKLRQRPSELNVRSRGKIALEAIDGRRVPHF